MKQDKNNKTITLTEEELDVIIKSAVKAAKEEKAEQDKKEAEKQKSNANWIVLVVFLCMALYFAILVIFFE